VEGRHGWARLVLPPPGAEEGGGFEEGHYFRFSRVDLHTVADTPVLADYVTRRTCNIACSSRGHVDIRARSST